jgi:hypothetical protein
MTDNAISNSAHHLPRQEFAIGIVSFPEFYVLNCGNLQCLRY